MVSERSALIAGRFGASVADYDRHATLQARIARRLATLLPPLGRPEILEIGCGTGLFTRHLLARYADGDFTVTDLAPAMVAACEARFGGGGNGRAVRYLVMDGEAPTARAPFDLIALSMTLQWFADPVRGLAALRALLKPGGALIYATLGPDGFPEWRAALAAGGLADGLLAMPALPGVVREERPLVDYGDGLGFLRRLRGIGATVPRPGYGSLTAAQLRRALRRLETDHAACVTWHIVYGRLAGAPA